VEETPFYEIRGRIRKPEPGTLEWFFREEKFLSWRDSDESAALWIRGSPGQGKSVLTKSILEHLEQQEQTQRQGKRGIIYFFCFNQAEHFRTTTSLVRALIVQLLTSPKLFDKIPKSYMQDPQNFRSATLSKLWEIFCSLVSDGHFNMVYCFIDALDECKNPRDDLLSKLKDLFTTTEKRRSHFKLFVTSRPREKDIDSAFIEFPMFDLRASGNDLGIFIESEISKLPEEQFTKELKKVVKKQLTQRVGCTFLWISTVVKELKDLVLPCEADIEAKVLALPEELDKLYKKLVDNMITDPKLAQLLAWVVYAREPLNLKVLEAALATDPENSCKSKKETEKYMSSITAEYLTKVAGTILDVVDSKVSLVHQSAKDFFEREKPLNVLPFCQNKDPNLYLVRVCLTYLNFDDFGRQEFNLNVRSGIRSDYPLLNYAARNWHHHISSKDDVQDFDTLLKSVISPGHRKTDLWLDWRLSDEDQRKSIRRPLDIAVELGIGWLAAYIVSDNNKIICSDLPDNWLVKAAGSSADILETLLCRYEETEITEDALKAAAGNRNGKKVLEILLSRNRDIKITDNVVEVAAGNITSGEEVIKFLLCRDKNIKITARVVTAAAENTTSGREIIRHLISYCNFTEITDDFVQSVVRHFGEDEIELALQDTHKRHMAKLIKAAAENEYRGKENIEYLFWHEKNIEISEEFIEIAARNFWTGGKIVKLLLSRAGHLKITEVIVRAAAENGWCGHEIMELLLSRASDIEITKEAAEDVARYFGKKEMVLLMSRDPKVEVTEKFVTAPAPNLWIDRETMNLLLSRNPEMEVSEEVLKAAAGNPRCGKEVIEYLLSRDKKIMISEEVAMRAIRSWRNARDVSEFLLSRYKRIKVTEGVVKELLLRCGEIQIADILMVVATDGSEEMVRLLLKLDSVSPGSRDWLEIAQLYNVAILGDEKAVGQLLGRGVESHLKDIKGRSLLYMAAGTGHAGVVGLLLENGANIEAEECDGWRALHAAALNGHEAIVRLLVERGANIDAQNKLGRSPLHAAALNGHAGVVQQLLENGANIKAESCDGWRALHTAAQNGHAGVVGLLLENGANIEAEDCDGWRALHSAAQNGHAGVVGLLLENGANIEAEDCDGWRALYAAVVNGHEVVVQQLLEKAASIEAENKSGLRPLHTAALNGHAGVVQQLLENGANIEAENCDSWRALHTAAQNGHAGVVGLLLENGANIEAEDCDGWRALHTAAVNGHEAIVRLLVESGAEIEAQDKLGRRPLHAAAMGGHERVVRVLVESGAEIEAQNKWGRRPLHTAAMGGHERVVHLLLENSANIEAKDSNDQTALHITALNRYNKVAWLLIKKGGDPCSLDNEGNTPWSLAKSCENRVKEIQHVGTCQCSPPCDEVDHVDT
jgi:ankyrin repeat protein